MAKGIRYTDEVKQEAVNQITKHSYDVAEVSTRLLASTKSLYKWRQDISRPTKFCEAKADIFNYIEMFYNPKRRHTHNGRKSPNETDKLYFENLESV